MELWIPYGQVEALLTIQIENLGELVDPKAEDHTSEVSTQVVERVKQAEKLIVCDGKRATLKTLKTAFELNPPSDALKVYSKSPKEVEVAAPSLKGKVSGFSKDEAKFAEERGIELSAPSEIRGQSPKVFLSTAELDPLYGLLDARMSGCLMGITNSRRLAYESSDTRAPRVLQKSASYDALFDLSSKVPTATFLSIIPRGGEPYRVFEDGGVENLKADFTSMGLNPTKAIVVAPGGKGYDDTLSHAVRSIWGTIESVRKSGAILLIAECSGGIGSQGLEMYLTGKVSDDKLDTVRDADGLEEVEYVRKLKNEYSVTLLSTLPEVYVEGKLGFRVTNGANEGLGKVLGSVGKSSKMNVVTRACETLLTKA